MGIKYNGTQISVNPNTVSYNDTNLTRVRFNTTKPMWPATIYFKKSNGISDVKLHTTPTWPGYSVGDWEGNEIWIFNSDYFLPDHGTAWEEYLEIILNEGYALPFIPGNHNLNKVKKYTEENPVYYMFTADGNINLSSIPFSTAGYTYNEDTQSVYVKHESSGGYTQGYIDFFLGSFDVLGAIDLDSTKIGTECSLESYTWNIIRNPTEYKLRISFTVTYSQTVTAKVGWWVKY